MRLPSFAALALTVLLPLSAAAATVTVRSGETLSDIAARYDVSVDSLMRMNGISNPDHRRNRQSPEGSRPGPAQPGPAAIGSARGKPCPPSQRVTTSVLAI